eukprot:s532_g7.t1
MGKNRPKKSPRHRTPRQELERELEKAAEESARGIVQRCIEAATTDSAKDTCFDSEEAKKEMAAISGRDPTEFKADDMREAMREGAERDTWRKAFLSLAW